MTQLQQVMAFSFFSSKSHRWISRCAKFFGGIFAASIAFSAHAQDLDPDPDQNTADPALRILSRIVEPQSEHVHSSSLAWIPDQKIMAAWYQGSGERTADDTRIMGSIGNPKSGAWGIPFILADTPDFPDCNPVVFTDPQDRLHLFWIIVRANRWERSLLMHRIAEKWDNEGKPIWTWQTPIILKPGESFDDQLKSGFEELDRDESMWAEFAPPYTRLLLDAAKIPSNRQEGWMPRNHPIILASGAWILPLYSDGFNVSLMAISENEGATWKSSGAIVGWGPIQPTLAQRKDGSIKAWFRDSGDGPGRVQVSHSTDDGWTWYPSRDSEIPNPGSSMEVIELSEKKDAESENWFVMIYNQSDTQRNQMRLALSSDGGESWPENWSRSLGDQRILSYPSMIEGKDGRIHISYSEKTDRGEAIGYESVDLNWILEK